MRTIFVSLVLAATLALPGCGGGAPSAAPAVEAPQEASLAIGDATVRANVIRTANVPAAMATQYGIAQDDDGVLLLVSVRRAGAAGEVSAPARVTARATDLQARARPVGLRELRVPDGAGGELVDHIGTLELDPPETLRFDIDVAVDGGASGTLTFTRDFRPLE